MINPNHPKYKDLIKEEVTAINLLHTVRDTLTVIAEQDVTVAKKVYHLWLENEYALQRLWGFPPDPTYIRFWYYPHCTCPRMDNEDNYPHGHYYTSSACPIHGVKL